MRLIDAEKLEKALLTLVDKKRWRKPRQTIMLLFALDIIRRTDTVEAKPVRHGRWIPQYISKRGLSDIFACSECNKTSFTYHMVKMCSYKYCSNCGAKMDGGEII